MVGTRPSQVPALTRTFSVAIGGASDDGSPSPADNTGAALLLSADTLSLVFPPARCERVLPPPWQAGAAGPEVAASTPLRAAAALPRAGFREAARAFAASTSLANRSVCPRTERIGVAATSDVAGGEDIATE